MDHYKKIKKFYFLLEKLQESLEKNNLWTELICKFSNNLQTLNETELKKTYWRVKNFKDFNKKKYIKKIIHPFSTVYEFENHYEWFVNDKKISLEEERLRLFQNYEIGSIYIDGILRKEYNDEDIKHAEKIKIIINKKLK